MSKRLVLFLFLLFTPAFAGFLWLGTATAATQVPSTIAPSNLANSLFQSPDDRVKGIACSGNLALCKTIASNGYVPVDVISSSTISSLNSNGEQWYIDNVIAPAAGAANVIVTDEFKLFGVPSAQYSRFVQAAHAANPSVLMGDVEPASYYDPSVTQLDFLMGEDYNGGPPIDTLLSLKAQYPQIIGVGEWYSDESGYASRMAHVLAVGGFIIELQVTYSSGYTQYVTLAQYESKLTSILCPSGNCLTTTQTSLSTSHTSTSTSQTSQSSHTSQSTTQTATTPSIGVTPTSAAVRSSILVSGLGFSASDTSCSLSGVAVGASTCSVSGGSLTATFVVANVAAGSYSITAMGSPSADSAIVNFQVLASGRSIRLNPASDSVGATVIVSGSGFAAGDTSCSLSGSPVASSGCLISGGALAGYFVVANVRPGSYTVAATGNSPGDSVSNTFTVLQPSITLIPAAARPGATVAVSGYGFFTTDTSCSFIGGALAAQTCSISASSLSGSFTVANTAPGPYIITAETSGPDSGLATAYLQVVNPVTTTTSTSFGSTVTQSLATTTMSTITGVSTTQSVSFTTVTVIGQSTASVNTASTITSLVTASSTTTLTETLLTTHNLMTGVIMGPSFDASRRAEDALGLVASLLMLIAMGLRKMLG